jgi:UMP-CMP kinase 2
MIQGDLALSVTGVELPEGPLYFCSEESPSRFVGSQSNEAQATGRKSFSETFARHFPSSVLFAFTSLSKEDKLHSSVKREVILRRREDQLLNHKPKGTGYLRLFRFFPEGLKQFERGCVLVAPNCIRKDAEVFVKELCVEFGQKSYCRVSSKPGVEVVQELVSVSTQDVESTSVLQLAPPPSTPPVFADDSHHSVYHSVGKLRTVLREMRELEVEGVDRLVSVSTQHSDLLEGGEMKALKPKNPVIVIEGLDGTGKSTLCHKLASSLNGTLLRTPPPCIAHLRSTFDDHPHLIRRAFYSAGNYIAAQEIMEKSVLGPVVVDRFWHSSAAYAIANDVGCGGPDNLPPPGHPLYGWPSDLLVPDCCVLLVVSPEERLRRMTRRGQDLTPEEKALEENRMFEERLFLQ